MFRSRVIFFFFLKGDDEFCEAIISLSVSRDCQNWKIFMRFIAGDTTLSAVGRKQFRGPNCAMNLDDSGTGAAPKIPYRRKYRLLRSELIGEGRDINASGVEIDTRDREKIPNHP